MIICGEVFTHCSSVPIRCSDGMPNSCNSPTNYLSTPVAEIVPVDDNIIPVYEPPGCTPVEPDPGRISHIAGAIAGRAIEAAGDIAVRGLADAIVTAPVSKEALLMAGYTTFSHSELLARACGVSEGISTIVWNGRRVALLTSHRPIKQPSRFTRPRSNRSKIADARSCTGRMVRNCRSAYRRLWIQSACFRWGNGRFRGCLHIDSGCSESTKRRATAFPGRWRRNEFLRGFRITIVCWRLYHDQGLPAIYALSGGEALHLTLGLPILRVGPWHGAAFEIAGSLSADPTPMRTTIHFAVDTILARHIRSHRNGDESLN